MMPTYMLMELAPSIVHFESTKTANHTSFVLVGELRIFIGTHFCECVDDLTLNNTRKNVVPYEVVEKYEDHLDLVRRILG